MPRTRDYGSELRARNARAREQGFRSYAAKRVWVAGREGFTWAQGRGHPAKGELPISEYRSIERDLSSSVGSYLVREPHSAKLRAQGKALLLTRDAATGLRRVHVLDRGQVESLFATVERRNELRQGKRGALVGQPPIQPPMETA